MGYTEAPLVLILSTTPGEILDKQIVRTFAKDYGRKRSSRPYNSTDLTIG